MSAKKTVSVKENAPIVTEAMVRRFCEAYYQAGDHSGSGLSCDGEYHKEIAAGLRAALSGRGRLCSPYMCPHDNPEPDPSYHNSCRAYDDDPRNGNRCYGFIAGVTDYYGIDGRRKKFGRAKRSKR